MKYLKKSELHKVAPKYQKAVKDAWNKGFQVPYGIIYVSDKLPTKEDLIYARKELPEFLDSDVIKAPDWLVERMEKIKNSPRPTLEQVRKQWEASKRIRRENAKCHKHIEYDMINPPSSDCYSCWIAYTDRHQTIEASTLLSEAMDKFDGLKD